LRAEGEGDEKYMVSSCFVARDHFQLSNPPR
jgi:hypothetical protein